MNKFLRVYTINREWHYAVYNSQGKLALWTTNRRLAEFYAREFAQNLRSTEITVGRIVAEQPKRR